LQFKQKATTTGRALKNIAYFDWYHFLDNKKSMDTKNDGFNKGDNDEIYSELFVLAKLACPITEVIKKNSKSKLILNLENPAMTKHCRVFDL
jgi:hypothetical protein